MMESASQFGNPAHDHGVGPSHLAIFAKYWTPGTVKTRLAARVGDEIAASLHQLFFTTLAARLRNVGDQRTMVVAPAAAANQFAQLANHQWNVVTQSGGDLGDRLDYFCKQQFARGHQRLVIIGADCPQIPAEHIAQSFLALQDHDVVLGKTEDGGYYLIGLRRALPIFDPIDWGSSQVFQQTIALVQTAGASLYELRSERDIDNYEDLDWLLEHLESFPAGHFSTELRQKILEQLELPL